MRCSRSASPSFSCFRFLCLRCYFFRLTLCYFVFCRLSGFSLRSFNSVFCGFIFSLIFSVISWHLFSNIDSPSSFFVCLFCGCSALLFRASLFLRWPTFFGVVIMSVAMTHLWSQSTWIMSLASASMLYFRCRFASHFLERSVCRLFSGSLPVHRVECCEIVHHQPVFHPSLLFVSTVECVKTNTCTLNSKSWVPIQR